MQQQSILNNESVTDLNWSICFKVCQYKSTNTCSAFVVIWGKQKNLETETKLKGEKSGFENNMKYRAVEN